MNARLLRSHGTAAARLALAVALSVVLTGCSFFGAGGSDSAKGDYNIPPTAVGEEGLSTRISAEQRLVVIGRFQDASESPFAARYDISKGMTDVLARSLVNHSRFDVWVNADLVQRVESILKKPQKRQSGELDRLRKEFPSIAYVISGRVTDFHHVEPAGPTKPPAGVVIGRRREALVAIMLTVVDMAQSRVVVSDHVYGTAPAGDQSLDSVYGNIAFGSYLFWDTPLGRASDAAIEETTTRLDRIIPTLDDSIRIVETTDDGRVRIAAGAQTSLLADHQYFVYLPADESDAFGHPMDEPLLDADSKLPLRVQVDEAGRISSEGKFLGEVPKGVDLRGATLRPIRAADMDLRIARQVGPREIVLSGLYTSSLRPGTSFYLFAPDPVTGRLALVRDPHTGEPLTANIIRVGKSEATAWLRGPLPTGVRASDGLLRASSAVESDWALTGVTPADDPAPNGDGG